MRFKVAMLAPPIAVLLLLFAALLWAAQGPPATSAQTPAGTYVTTQRFEDYIRSHSREHELLAGQVGEARKVVDERLQGMNELRAQIQSERGNYQPRAEATLTRERLEERLNRVEQAVASTASSSRTWTAAVGFFFTVVMIAMRWFPSRRDGDQKR